MSDDIEALVFQVMEHALADANADLREIMEELRKRPETLGRLRKAAAELAAYREANSAGDSDLAKSLRAFVIDLLKGTSDMSEVLQQRLQMAMERRSKAMEVLSNLMKKQSETASCIIKNMK